MIAGMYLRNAIRGTGLTVDEAAKKLGISRATLQGRFNHAKLDESFIQDVKTHLGIDIKALDVQTNDQGVPVPQGGPVYDLDATAGDLQFNGDMPETVQGHISLPNFRECIAFLYVRGDSMYSILKAGDLIGLIPVTDMDFIQYGNIYLVVTHDNQRMVKFIRKSEQEDHIILRSKNKEYDDILLKTDKIRKLFRVKGPIRDDWQ